MAKQKRKQKPKKGDPVAIVVDGWNETVLMSGFIASPVDEDDDIIDVKGTGFDESCGPVLIDNRLRLVNWPKVPLMLDDVKVMDKVYKKGFCWVLPLRILPDNRVLHINNAKIPAV